MARQIGRVALVVILLFTAACTPNDGDTLPTSAALPTDDPATEVPVEEEATPTAEVLLATAENLRPTLPPTFTPTVEGDSQEIDDTDDASASQPSNPTSTPSSETSNPPPVTSGERPACVDFEVDLLIKSGRDDRLFVDLRLPLPPLSEIDKSLVCFLIF